MPHRSGVMHSSFGGSSGHRARYVAPRYANAQLHMRLDGMSKGGKAARPWSMRLATAGRELKPPICEPQSNYSLDELAHDAAPIEDGRLRPAHAVSVGGEAGPVRMLIARCVTAQVTNGHRLPGAMALSCARSTHYMGTHWKSPAHATWYLPAPAPQRLAT